MTLNFQSSKSQIVVLLQKRDDYFSKTVEVTKLYKFQLYLVSFYKNVEAQIF